MRTPLMVVLAALFITCTAGGAVAQTLTSDQPDYAPGTTATLTGAGFAPSESVVVVVHHADASPDSGAEHEPWTVVADENGGFVTTWHVCEDDCVGKTLRATADGQTSGLHAEVVFTDGTLQIKSVSNALISPSQASSAGVQDNTDITATNGSNGSISGVTVRIRAGTSLGGTLVREYTIGTLDKGKDATVNWDGKNSSAVFVAEGIYTARAFSPSTLEIDLNNTQGTITVDNTNPTVTLSSPADGTCATGTSTLTASPLDAGGHATNIDQADVY